MQKTHTTHQNFCHIRPFVCTRLKINKYARKESLRVRILNGGKKWTAPLFSHSLRERFQRKERLLNLAWCICACVAVKCMEADNNLKMNESARQKKRRDTSFSREVWEFKVLSLNIFLRVCAKRAGSGISRRFVKRCERGVGVKKSREA